MSISTGVLQGMSNLMAAYGNEVSLHTADMGNTGANEATGGGYGRQQSPNPTPDGAGDNNYNQVNIPCLGGSPGTSYFGGGVWSTQDGTTLAVPSGVTATGSSTGGTLPAGTYYYVVTAFNMNGETTKSTEVSAVVTGTTSSVALSFTHVAGVYDLPSRAAYDAGYHVYRGTASGSENVLIATLPASATTWTDTGGAAGTSATPPATNTASTWCWGAEFDGGPIIAVGTGTSINVSPSNSVTG